MNYKKLMLALLLLLSGAYAHAGPYQVMPSGCQQILAEVADGSLYAVAGSPSRCATGGGEVTDRNDPNFRDTIFWYQLWFNEWTVRNIPANINGTRVLADIVWHGGPADVWLSVDRDPATGAELGRCAVLALADLPFTITVRLEDGTSLGDLSGTANSHDPIVHGWNGVASGDVKLNITGGSLSALINGVVSVSGEEALPFILTGATFDAALGGL